MTVFRSALLDVVAPMSTLRSEYENGCAFFVKQIYWLQRMASKLYVEREFRAIFPGPNFTPLGDTSIYLSEDADCFYRCDANSSCKITA